MEKTASRHDLLNGIRNIAIGGALGYAFFWLTSNPTKSPLKKRFPQKKYKNIYYFPNVKITRKEREYWFHHWLNLSVLYAILLLKKNRLRSSKLTHGFLLGSILQGLLYPDRFRIIDRPSPILVPEPTGEK